MYVLVVDFVVKPEHVKEFTAAIRENARASRETEPGCRQFDVCVAPENPAIIVLYEVYDDRAAFEAHLKTPHFLACKPKLDAWLEANKVRFLSRVDP
jgi:(4S)-4-hydroxy-5-phosphonooxypentane-2,3-dione isomerase